VPFSARAYAAWNRFLDAANPSRLTRGDLDRLARTLALAWLDSTDLDAESLDAQMTEHYFGGDARQGVLELVTDAALLCDALGFASGDEWPAVWWGHLQVVPFKSRPGGRRCRSLVPLLRWDLRVGLPGRGDESVRACAQL